MIPDSRIPAERTQLWLKIEAYRALLPVWDTGNNLCCGWGVWNRAMYSQLQSVNGRPTVTAMSWPALSGVLPLITQPSTISYSFCPTTECIERCVATPPLQYFIVPPLKVTVRPLEWVPCVPGNSRCERTFTRGSQCWRALLWKSSIISTAMF